MTTKIRWWSWWKILFLLYTSWMIIFSNCFSPPLLTQLLVPVLRSSFLRSLSSSSSSLKAGVSIGSGTQSLRTTRYYSVGRVGRVFAISTNSLTSPTTSSSRISSPTASSSCPASALFSSISSSLSPISQTVASSSSASKMTASSDTSTGFLNAADAAALDVELMSPDIGGYTLEQLMELAGMAVAEAVMQVVPTSSSSTNSKKKVLVLCGPGNNGGDGLVAARHLYFYGGYDCTIVYPKRSSKQPHYSHLVKQCENLGIPVVDEVPATTSMSDYDIIVDALFGFSFHGEPREPFAAMLQQVMAAQKQQQQQNPEPKNGSPVVVSVDVPSGWNVDEGDVNKSGFVPDVLVSLTTPKLCAKKFTAGRHFVGGRFLPPDLASKYNVKMPPYPSISQVMEVPVENEDQQIIQKKKGLRKEIRSKTKVLTKEEIDEQSTKVWKQVMELDVYKSASSVGLFLSMPKGEINTDYIIEDCIRQNKQIWVPEVGPNFENPDMDLRKVILVDSDDENQKLFHKLWPTNKWNIPEPPSDMPFIVARPGDIDLLIVPGLGFDTARNRLGQGKGYYDRFIAKMNDNASSSHNQKTMPLVAVALTPQLVLPEDKRIPVGSYDKPMDIVVLPDRIITDDDGGCDADVTTG
mmetsp:Transcript_20939/g.49735  ORF Transcript_20939/g.49735 Transcript_20939/m.49735 type:complete len:636 (-) Transcript_20939:237-2144(-)